MRKKGVHGEPRDTFLTSEPVDLEHGAAAITDPLDRGAAPRRGREKTAPIGVALSGGGVRASLFSLGALLFLVDSGLSRRVREIASVSGGSITNAFVAQHCHFR